MRPNVLRNPGDRPRVVGHRGAPGSYGIPRSKEMRVPAPPEEAARYGPENTAAAFERAVALGADLIELDVHLSADDHVVVIHDDTVDRTTNGTGEVADMTLAELQALDAGSWYGPAFAGLYIPSLDQVLAWARDKVAVDIEVKAGRRPQAGIEEKVVELLQRHDMLDQALVISFDHTVVARVKQLKPTAATGILYVCRPVDAVALAEQAHADALLPQWTYLCPEDVAAANDAGLAVAPWTTSDPEVVRRLLKMGVDAIGTNHPDRLHELVVTE